MEIKKLVIPMLAMSILGLSLFARADGDESDYDSIVTDLNNQTRTRAQNTKPSSEIKLNSRSLDEVLFHGGVGYSNLFGTLNFPDGSKTFLNEKGVQMSLGIDLLSPEWIAEGSVQSYSDADYVQNGVSAKAFDLKVAYRPRILENLIGRFAAGISGQYLSVNRGVLGTTSDSTPASVLALGADWMITPMWSFGAEAQMRSAMQSQSIQQTLYAATIRVDAHF